MALNRRPGKVNRPGWRRSALLLPIIAIGLFLPTSSASPAETSKASAWIPYWDQTRAYQSFMANADLFGEVSPMWYEMVSTSEIARYPAAEDATVLAGLRSKDVKLIPTITNGFDPVRVSTMLATDASRSSHVNVLVNLVVSKGYDGLDVDYESLASSDRDAFSSFVGKLAASLHAANKSLTVTVHPKTAEPGNWSGPQAQDWAAIGRVVDRLRVMAYDYHWSTSSAGPIAPVTWVDDVARFASTQVAPAKVQLGLGLYGYDWVGSAARDLTFDVVQARAAQYGAVRQWSTVDAAPWFTYVEGSVSHEVWYEDVQSVSAKLPSVDRYGLGGVIFWRLGGEDARVWDAVRSRWGVATTTSTSTTSTTTQSPVPSDTVAPSTPADLTATGGKRLVSLDWSDSSDSGGSGLAGYDVYRSSSPGGPFSLVARAPSSAFQDRTVTRRATYWYRVSAVDGAGNRSTASNTASAMVQ